MSLHPKLQHLLDVVTLASPFARMLGIRLESTTPDVTVLVLPFRPDSITFADVIHGGVIATLIDVAAAAAFVAGADPEMKGGATSSMTISYLAAARSVDLTATASILRRGRGQTVSEVAVTAPDGVLVAKGLVTSRGF